MNRLGSAEVILDRLRWVNKQGVSLAMFAYRGFCLNKD